MAEAIGGPGTQVERVERLKGGLACSTHAVRLSGVGWVVVKRSLAGGRSLSMEHDALVVARRSAVPTPEPLALDRRGDWFGRPALAMSRLPGRSDLHGGRPGPWIVELAEAVAAVHATPMPARLPVALRRPHAWQAWDVPTPTQVRRTPLVERALAEVVSLQSAMSRRPPATTFVHHDLHPGNVAWHRGRLSAVLDWNEARLGPAVSDVAYCSVDLAMSHGRRGAELLVDAYVAASGGSMGDLPRWQLFWAVNAMRWIPYWREGYVELGLGHISIDTLRKRLRTFTERTLADIGA